MPNFNDTFDSDDYSNLVMSLEMDEASWSGNENEVVDASGRGNHGTAFNGVSTAAGKLGNAGDFVKANSHYVKVIPNDLGFTIGDGVGVDYPFTVMAWVNMVTTNNFYILTGYWSATGIAFNTGTYTNGKLFLIVRDTSNYYIGQLTDTSFSGDGGSWHHYAATYSGGQTNESIKLYRDGVLTSSANLQSGAYTHAPRDILRVTIGEAVSAYADGKIDQPRFYSKELTATEIQYIYNSDSGRYLAQTYSFNPNEIEVVDGKVLTRKIDLEKFNLGNYRFEEAGYTDAPNEVQDSSDRDFHLTPNNGVTTTASGRVGRAATFVAASSQYIRGSHSEYSPGLADFSITGSFKTDTAAANATVVGFRYLSSATYQVYVDIRYGYLYFWTYNGSVTRIINSPIAVNDDEWHFFAAVRKDGDLYLYLDDEDPIIDIGSARNMSLSYMTIGARYSISLVDYYDGEIDEINYFRTALSAQDVADLYASFRMGYYSGNSPSIYRLTGYTDADLSILTAFTETLGSGNTGSFGYQLSVDGVNWLYYNSGWTAAGATNYNTAAVVNTNAATFPVSGDTIYVKAFAVSDTDQLASLDSIQIGYTGNLAPVVYAGTDKNVKSGETFNPFSDNTQSDPDGTIEQDECRAIGYQENWKNIPIDGYATFQEAAAAKTATVNTSGTYTFELRVTDDQGAQTTDSLVVTVSKRTVTFNVLDDSGNHIDNLSFDPDDGSGVQVVDSPFTWDFDVDSYNITISKTNYRTEIETTIVVASDGQVYNYTLSQLLAVADIPLIWQSATRTLTATVREIQEIMANTISLTSGTTFAYSFSALGNITDKSEVWFAVKRKLDEDDDDSQIFISLGTGLEYINGEAAATAANGSITLDDESLGNITVTLKPAETAKLKSMINGYYQIKVLRTSGIINELESGFFTTFQGLVQELT